MTQKKQDDKILMLNEFGDFDFRFFINFVNRNKIFIASLSFFITLLTGIVTSTQKPTWEGSFEILVEGNKNSSMNRVNTNTIAQLALNSNSFIRKNELIILQSPSVLLPVFDFVKEEKLKKGIDIGSNNPKKWLDNNLDISFANKGADILNVSFRDKDKELIIKTLDLISEKYKEYSKKDQEISLKNSLEFLEKQKIIYEAKTLKSNKEFNKFAIKNGLGNFDAFYQNTNLLESNNNNTKLRNPAISNQTINFNLDNDISKNASKRYTSQFMLLEQYERKYSDLSSNLKENSNTLKTLKNKIENLREFLKRPNEILSEYMKLKRVANRDNQLLTNIENQLAVLKLEKSKIKTTWDLTYEPYVNDVRVAPNIKYTMFLGLIFATILGMFISWIKEKVSGKIFDFLDFERLMPCEFINFLYLDKEINQLLISTFLEENNLENANGCILPIVCEIKNNEFLNQYINSNDNLTIISKIDEIKKYDYVILLTESRGISFKKLKAMTVYIENFKKKLKGWYFLNESEISKQLD